MNFEFLKDLRGLSEIYQNCSDAEKLAISMPDKSIFSSRKSAELLAKFIYMAAHNQRMEELSFMDILSDKTFCDFVHNRNVIDSFHYIRKNGNRAAHSGDSKASSENAIAVLQDLHYISGEIACMLGLIKEYPDFESRIESYPDAKFYSEEDIEQKIEQKAIKMFLSYAENFDAQMERDQYYEMKDYDHFRYLIEGNVEMHEYLEFKCKPKQLNLIEYLQNYLSTLLRLSIERSPENLKLLNENDPELADDPYDEEYDSVTFNATLTVGQKCFSSTDAERFRKALYEELPNAEGFIVDLTCKGVLRELFSDEPDEEGNGRINMIRKDTVWTGSGMLDTLEEYKRRNPFTYKLFVFYPDSSEFVYAKILDGKDIDVLASGTEDIVDQTCSHDWWSEQLNLWAAFDISKYPDKVEQLHNIVRSSIPEDQVRYCEEVWEDEDEDVCNPTLLCHDIQFDCKSLRTVQDFLDKINAVLLPIKDEIIDAGGDGTWEVREDFAVATWAWTDEGFKVKGLKY